MKVRRGAKTAMPPRVVKCVRQNSFEAGGGYVSCHLVADQTNLSQKQWGDVRIGRIVKGRHEKSRTIRALLMNVIDNFRKPFLPKKMSNRLRFFQVEHEPIPIIIVSGVVMVKLGRLASFGRGAERLAIPVGDDIHAVWIWGWNQNDNYVVQDRQGVTVVCTRQVVSQLCGHLRSNNL